MSFSETEKLFQGIPLSQIGFARCLIILGGCQNHFGNFLEFSEIKTENVSEPPVPLWPFSQMKFTNLKLFQNKSKIILVGTGIILRPTEIFSDLVDAKIVFMNSENAFLFAFRR